MTFLLVLIAASPLKSADPANRTKLDAVCARLERRGPRRDPWAWIELASCELKRDRVELALMALEMATRLELERPDLKVHDAIEEHRKRLGESVVACPSRVKSCEVVAASLAKVLSKPVDLQRQLFAKARDLLTDEELAAAPTPPFANAQGPFDRCATLTSPGCPHAVLLCERSSTEADGRASTRRVTGFLVDPAEVGAWANQSSAPTTSSLTLEVERFEDGRCPISNDAGSPEAEHSQRLVIEANACTGRLVTLDRRHNRCASNDSLSRKVEPFAFIRPP